MRIMRIKFFKMHGSGNDFVVIDNRIIKLRFEPELIRAICERHKGIGADGVLLLEKGDLSYYRMRYYNSDGGEVDMCGNGARCIGYFVYLADGISNFPLQTNAGIIEIKVVSDYMVQVELPRPESVRTNFKIDGYSGEYHFVIIGVPHLVKFVEKVELVDVIGEGRTLRYKFMPGGTNVDFVEVIDKQTIRLRTYERGVEDETLSCGTGAVASAFISALLNLVNPPVKVVVNYPEPLNISFGEGLMKPKLTGPVRLSFTGEIEIPF